MASTKSPDLDTGIEKDTHELSSDGRHHRPFVCVKNCQYCRNNSQDSKSKHPWTLDPPAADIGPGNGKVQQNSPLLALPPEIRNMIYKLILTRRRRNARDQIEIRWEGNQRHCHCDECDRTEDALLLTCRSVYHDAVGLSLNTNASLKFSGMQSLLRFLHQTSSRRQEGIQNLVIALSEPEDSMHDLIGILQSLRTLSRLVKVGVEVHVHKLLECLSQTEEAIKEELGKMVELERFDFRPLFDRDFLRDTKRRREVVRFVKETCAALPKMREVEIEVKGFWIKSEEEEEEEVGRGN